MKKLKRRNPMAKISKTTAVEYKGKKYTLEQFANYVRGISKEEMSELVVQRKYTALLAQYVKDYPECLKESGAIVATKK